MQKDICQAGSDNRVGAVVEKCQGLGVSVVLVSRSKKKITLSLICAICHFLHEKNLNLFVR